MQSVRPLAALVPHDVALILERKRLCSTFMGRTGRVHKLKSDSTLGGTHEKKRDLAGGTVQHFLVRTAQVSSSCETIVRDHRRVCVDVDVRTPEVSE